MILSALVLMGCLEFCGWMWQRQQILILLVVCWLCGQCHHCWLMFGFIGHYCPRFSLSVIQCFVNYSLSWPQFYFLVCQLSFFQGLFCINFQIGWRVKLVDFLLELGRCVLPFLCILLLILWCLTFFLLYDFFIRLVHL